MINKKLRLATGTDGNFYEVFLKFWTIKKIAIVIKFLHNLFDKVFECELVL
jgi:hypothetical protein